MDDKATAAKVLDQVTFATTTDEAVSYIVAALEAARRSVTDAARGIIDCTGEVPVVRRVLGHLAITKDGWVIGDDCRVWQDGQMWNTELFRVPTESNGRWAPYRTNKVFSSESAAKAAMEGGKA
jgi:hypothetical protein